MRWKVLIHLLSKCFLSTYCKPGCALGTGDIRMCKETKALAFPNLILGTERKLPCRQDENPKEKAGLNSLTPSLPSSVLSFSVYRKMYCIYINVVYMMLCSIFLWTFVLCKSESNWITNCSYWELGCYWSPSAWLLHAAQPKPHRKTFW